MKTPDATYACGKIKAGWNNRAAPNEEGVKAQKILAAISPSAGSHEALITALALVRQCGGSIVLAQAVELNIPGEERGIARGELLRDLMTAAESNLTKLAGAFCGDVPSVVIITEGPPSLAIVRTAHGCGADAIVVGPRRPGFLRRFRRNTVQAVLRDAGLPVYLVAPRESLEVHRSQELAACAS